MTIDPSIVVAIIALFSAAYATWRTANKEEKTAKISANAEGIKVTAELDVKREELLTAGIEAHFNRLEEQIEKAEARIDALSKRVDQLEEERERMLAWMRWNELGWPPPDDVPI